MKNRKQSGNAFKSRKQIRKEQRKDKKARRNEYYTNRNKNGKYVRNPNKLESIQSSLANSDQYIKSKPSLNAKQNSNKSNKRLNNTKQNSEKPKSEITITKDQEQYKALQKEKREYNKLQKQMNKQRKVQLQEANVDEDRNIKRLEKQLGLNKRKSKSTPKTFVEDGLDYLLEVCDSDNMKSAIATEQQFNEINDDFEEDLALMTGKTLKKTNDEDESDFDMDEDSEDDEENSDYDDIQEEEDEMDISEGEDDKIPEEKSSNKSKQNKVAFLSENDDEEVSDEPDDFDDEMEQEEGSSENNDGSDIEEKTKENEADDETKKTDVWEDIYGRLRGKDGSIVTQTTEDKYIPPAVRARMEAASSDNKEREVKLNRLRRQLKGLLNRLAESNMHSITSQIEDLYMNNSRNDMNETLTSLILESLVTTVLTPERLLLEHVMLVTILHANVGTEVGAHFLQTVIKKFNNIFTNQFPVENKMLDNIICVTAQLYNFKVFHVSLIYEVLNKLSKRFTETDIECILLILKGIGFSLRKEDPLALKNLIIALQKQATNASNEVRDNPRVKFMLDILLAVKNNNMSKIPNYDTSYSEHLKKLLKGLIRKGSYVTTLNISLEDLLKADEYGKWWVVGSAWTGKTTEINQNQSNANKTEGFSQKLLDLAQKQRMNTDTRRNIFCIMMSAEDYLEAFEKLLKLGLKNQQEREIIHVILHCCLQEKVFNPYYAVLAQKFCEYDRRFQMIIKYSAWDKLKALTQCSLTQLSNLAKLLTHLFLEKGLPISTLKIVQFSELDKITLRFMRQILIGILLCEDEETCQAVFSNISQSDKLKMFRESMRLFIQHFLLKNLKSHAIPSEQKELLENRAKIIDRILSVSDKKIKF